MQMIDVLKRLAELDATNPNVVKEGQLGTMGLDAFPDELARMRATREKMDNDTEWLLKNKPTDPCSKCGEPTTYRSSFGTTQKLICAKCGEVRLSSDDRKEHQDMAESDNDLVGMVQSTIEDILSGAQQGQDMTDNIADELGDHFDAVQNSGDENLKQAYSMVRDAADTSPEEQAQAAQSALEMLSGGEQGMAEAANPKIDTRATEKYALKVVNDFMYDSVGRDARYLTNTAGLPFTYYNEDELQKTGVAKFSIPYVDDDTPQGSNGIGSKYEALENIWTHYFRGKQAEGWLSSQPRQMPTGKTTSDGKKIWTFVFSFAIPNKGQQFEQQDVSESLEECGMMGGMSPRPHSPATINMTADSGAELTGMLKDIMQLAGLKQVTPHDLGHEHEPAVISAEPGISVAKVDSEPLDMKSMLAKIDSMNDTGDEKPVEEWNNTPVDATDVPEMDKDAMLNKGMHNQDPAGTPGAGDGRHLKNNPIATPEETYESLMAEYKKFISEN